MQFLLSNFRLSFGAFEFWVREKCAERASEQGVPGAGAVFLNADLIEAEHDYGERCENLDAEDEAVSVNGGAADFPLHRLRHLSF